MLENAAARWSCVSTTGMTSDSRKDGHSPKTFTRISRSNTVIKKMPPRDATLRSRAGPINVPFNKRGRFTLHADQRTNDNGSRDFLSFSLNPSSGLDGVVGLGGAAVPLQPRHCLQFEHRWLAFGKRFVQTNPPQAAPIRRLSFKHHKQPRDRPRFSRNLNRGRSRLFFDLLTSKNLFHWPSLCQFVNKFIQVADFAHYRLLDFLYPNPTDHTLDGSP